MAAVVRNVSISPVKCLSRHGPMESAQGVGRGRRDWRKGKGGGGGEVEVGGNMLYCERGGGLTTDQHKIYAFLKLACPYLTFSMLRHIKEYFSRQILDSHRSDWARTS